MRATGSQPSAIDAAGVQAAIARGVALQRAGKLREAEAICRRILKKDRNETRAMTLLASIQLRRRRFDDATRLLERSLDIEARQPAASTHLGRLYLQQNNPQAALSCYERAIAANPAHAELHNERGVALQALGRLEEALASFDEAIAVAPGHVDILNNRGNLLQSLGRHAEAVSSYERAISLMPNQPQLHYNRANALQHLERHEEAIAGYDRAIELKPDYPLAFNNRGLSLAALDRQEEALAAYERAIALSPSTLQSYLNRGNTLQASGNFEEAIRCYDRALAIDPADATFHFSRGTALYALERHEEAIAAYDEAIALKPDYPEALNNRGNAFLAMNRQAEALSCYLATIALEPRHSRAIYNRGKVLQNLGRHLEALASYDEAIEIDPDYAAAYWSKSLLTLLRGELELGFRLYEWRWKYDKFPSPNRGFAEPLWLGATPLEGKTILLYAEQGYGDTIQFCRYAKRVADLGATVVLEVAPVLTRLMGSLDGVDHIVARGDALPRVDCQTPLASLPLAFGTDLSSIPALTPYLRADPAAIAGWSKRLEAGARLRVGLVWSGNPAHTNDRNRSIPFVELAPLVRRGIDFVGLQREVRAEDEAALAGQPGIENLGPSLKDFADTAALIASLDLVISVDTSVAHLAGALGKPVWVMLPHAPDWRWLLDREDSPWYPTMRLFRQSAAGDWKGVVTRVADALKDFDAAR